jgi:tRNA-specific 2-thiouridylase
MLGKKESLLRRKLFATQTNWLSDRIVVGGASVRCTAKIRYNSDPQPATVCATSDGEMMVEFDEPQSAITPGQAVVVYDGDVLLGGGWIDQAME